MELNCECRHIAFSILNEHHTSNKTIDIVIEKNYRKIKELTKLNKKLFNSLVFGVLRWKNKLDWIIEILSYKIMPKMSYKVKNILRLAIIQIFFMDKIPNSAVVNSSVILTKTSFFPKEISGYINFFLRNIIIANSAKKILSKPINSINYLSVSKSFPKWILLRWIKKFGNKRTKKYCDLVNSIPEITIRVNTLKINKKKIKEQIKSNVKNIKSNIFPNNALKLTKNTKIIDNEFFNKGLFSVQNLSSQIASQIFSPLPGEVILDACTGFGTKATHIAELMNNKGIIIAVDKINYKIKKLKNECNRLGIKIIKALNIDVRKVKQNPKYYSFFDKILLDAPCSGLGTIQKNPDIKWKTNIRKIKKCSENQVLLLNDLSELVKPGGTIAYVVCSFEWEENEQVIKLFLKKNINFKVDVISNKYSVFFKNYSRNNNFTETCLSKKEVDGLFVTLLKKVNF